MPRGRRGPCWLRRPPRARCSSCPGPPPTPRCRWAGALPSAAPSGAGPDRSAGPWRAWRSPRSTWGWWAAGFRRSAGCRPSLKSWTTWHSELWRGWSFGLAGVGRACHPEERSQASLAGTHHPAMVGAEQRARERREAAHERLHGHGLFLEDEPRPFGHRGDRPSREALEVAPHPHLENPGVRILTSPFQHHQEVVRKPRTDADRRARGVQHADLLDLRPPLRVGADVPQRPQDGGRLDRQLPGGPEAVPRRIESHDNHDTGSGGTPAPRPGLRPKPRRLLPGPPPGSART